MNSEYKAKMEVHDILFLSGMTVSLIMIFVLSKLGSVFLFLPILGFAILTFEYGYYLAKQKFSAIQNNTSVTKP